MNLRRILFILVVFTFNQILSMAQNTINKKALLIVDVQNDFTGLNAKMPVDKAQADEMIANLNGLVSKPYDSPLTVIYIGNEYSKFDLLNVFRNFAAVKGTIGTQMDPRLQVVSKNYFSKSRGNAFSNQQLDLFLKRNNINELYIGGLYAEACIYATVKGAIKLHYTTTILTDCVATKSEVKRAKMIKKYNELGAKTIGSKQLLF
jgi:nicotinamidase-related amidase